MWEINLNCGSPWTYLHQSEKCVFQKDLGTVSCHWVPMACIATLVLSEWSPHSLRNDSRSWGAAHVCTSSCPHGAKMTPQGQEQTSTKTFLTPEVCRRYLCYAPKSLSLQPEQGYYVRLHPATIQVWTARSSSLCFVRRLPEKIINSFLSQRTVCSMQMKANCSGVNHLTCHWATESFWS